MKRTQIFFSVTAILIFTFIISCTKTDSTGKGIITFTVGTVTITDTTGKKHTAQVTDTVAPGAIITTGPSSEATIQVNRLGLLRVLQNSRIALTSLFEKKKGSMVQVDRGSLFSKITKMKKGGKFQVKTPTSLASVRGTEFLTKYNAGDKIATVSLKSGSVEVVSTTETKAVPKKVISPGEVAIVKMSKTEIKKQTPGETLELEKLSLHPFIERAGKKNRDEINKEIDSIKGKEVELEKEINKSQDLSKLPPLDRLRAMGRTLTKLHLRDGSKLIGNVKSQNAKVIRLDNGIRVLTIPKSDIIRREPVR